MDDSKSYNTISLDLASLLNAFGHPARLQILMHLAKYKDCNPGSIAENLPLAKSTISEHLRKLKQAGLIICSPSGACLQYQLNDAFLATVKTKVFDFFKTIENEESEQISCTWQDKAKNCPFKNK
ncbi:MAG: metalloregulator ArsR/SmtB family transcription factor [Bacteroidota bacterium]|nr:metalloregulator ArsR/SmtB family transcription factor [Bacteroidota bacterium]